MSKIMLLPHNNLCVCVHACVCVCMHVCMCVCMHVCVKYTWTSGRGQTLHILSLLMCCRATKVVKVDVEPLVDLCVEFVVFVTDLFGRHSLLQGLGFRRSAVLISATDVQNIVVSQSTKPETSNKVQCKSCKACCSSATDRNLQLNTKESIWCISQDLFSSTFLKTLPELVRPLKGYSLSPCCCSPMLLVPSQRSGY